MVIKKQSWTDVEGHKDINRVVLMGGKDEEDTEEITQPSECVEPVYSIHLTDVNISE